MPGSHDGQLLLARSDAAGQRLALPLGVLVLLLEDDGFAAAFGEAAFEEVLFGRVGRLRHRTELLEAYLPVSVQIQHRDHHVDLFVRHVLAHHYEDVLQLRHADVAVLVEIAQDERALDGLFRKRLVGIGIHRRGIRGQSDFIALLQNVGCHCWLIHRKCRAFGSLERHCEMSFAALQRFSELSREINRFDELSRFKEGHQADFRRCNRFDISGDLVLLSDLQS